MKKTRCALMVFALGGTSPAASMARNLAIESLQLHWDVRTWDVTYVFTPPFTEFVVSIELPFIPDPEAFQSTLLPVTCG